MDMLIYADYSATHEILYYSWASFFVDDENDSNSEGF